MRLALQRALHGARPPRRRLPLSAAVTARVGALGALARLLRRLAALRRRQIDARLPRLRQADRDRLLRRLRAVLALADVVHFLAYELATLRRGGFALLLVAAG